MRKTEPFHTKLTANRQQTVRRTNSMSSNTSKKDKDKDELDEEKIRKDTELITTIIEEKLNPFRDEIKKMLDTHLSSINVTIDTTLDTQKYIVDKHEEITRKKYNELAEKYIELRNIRQTEFYRHTEIVAQYQRLIVKICTKIFAQSTSNTINTEEAEMMSKILLSLSRDISRTDIASVKDKNESDDDDSSSNSPRKDRRKPKVVTNPIITRRNSSSVLLYDSDRRGSECIDDNLADILG